MARKFPENFKFGVATAAYQIEGAWNEDGKSENIWDYQCHNFPTKIEDCSNGDIACDSYHQLDEDIKNLKLLKVNFYRFSISWCRILPTGFPNKINQLGIDYYNNVVNRLLENGIEPWVTIYHWDLPQRLENLGGWTNRIMADFYLSFARICFENFGDRVKVWFTINEPYQIANLAYSESFFAPFYELKGIGCYLAGHTLLIAHAKAYHLYDQVFRRSQRGRIGIVIESPCCIPYTNTKEDIEATERYMQMYYGHFANPIFSKSGNYPLVMRERIDKLSKEQGFDYSRLPKFTNDEVEMLKGSSDFLGLNHYRTYYTKNESVDDVPSHNNDMGVKDLIDEKWKETAAYDFRVVPEGMRGTLNWIKNRFGNPEVLILENGMGGREDEPLDDRNRVDYYNSYLDAILAAILDDGCNVTAYCAWSFMDNFEWCSGYQARFGLFHVDFKDPKRKRTPKTSAYAYQNIVVKKQTAPELYPRHFLH